MLLFKACLSIRVQSINRWQFLLSVRTHNERSLLFIVVCSTRRRELLFSIVWRVSKGRGGSMAFYDFISFFELKLSWDISTHDPGSCLDLFHSGKKRRITQVHSRKDPWIFWTFSNFLDGLSQAALPRLLLMVVVVKFYGSIEFAIVNLLKCRSFLVFMLHVLVHTFTQRRFVATFNHQGETPIEWAWLLISSECKYQKFKKCTFTTIKCNGSLLAVAKNVHFNGALNNIEHKMATLD